MEYQEVQSETFLVQRDRLLAASALVPADRRASFFTTLLMGADVLDPDPDGEIEIVNGDAFEDVQSFALNASQARELKGKVDNATWAVIRAIVANSKAGVGTIDWSEVKRLTGVSNWAQFAKGRMGGLHRSLRKIAGVPGDAVLLWEGEGWVEDLEGDYSAGTIGIDGPAVRVLRAISGLPEGD